MMTCKSCQRTFPFLERDNGFCLSCQHVVIAELVRDTPTKQLQKLLNPEPEEQVEPEKISCFRDSRSPLAKYLNP